MTSVDPAPDDPKPPSPAREPTAPSRVSARFALLVLGSLMCATAVAVLTWLSGAPVPAAVLGGLFAWGGAFTILDRLIE